ncbi:MAG: hypothetical protein AAGH76_14990 [Pseudomonadota bacterium]
MVAVVAKLALAVMLAPLSSLVAIGCVLLVWGVVLGHESFVVSSNFQLFSIYGLMVSYAFAVCIGVPTNLVLRAVGKNAVSIHVAIGVVVSLLFGLWFFGLGRALTEAPLMAFVYASLLVVPGVTVSAVFGLIAGDRRASTELDHAS